MIDVYFLYVNVFWFCLIPLLVLGFLILSNQSGFEEFFSARALQRLQTSGWFTHRQRVLFLFIALIFIVFAMARGIIIFNHTPYEMTKVFVMGAILFFMMGHYSLPK